MVLYSCYCLGHFRISGVLVGFHSEMKRAMCIVELYNHTGIFKNTRDVRRSTSRRQVPLTLLEEQVYFFLL